MAEKSRKPRRSSPDELNAGTTRAMVTSPGDVIEYDPLAPPQTAQARAASESVEGLDLVQVPREFFDLRDELLERFATPQAFAAQAEVGPDERSSRVLGVGIGFKTVGGILTGDPAVQVLVEAKLPMDQVASEMAVPSSVGRVPTDVLEVGSIFPQGFASRYKRPVPCGASVGHVEITAGTIGCLVLRNNNHLCILSNNHVLANCNKAKAGDLILQPGRADGGQAPGDAVASLEDFVPLNAGAVNLVDAAVGFTSFKLASPDHVTYKAAPGPVTPALGLSVMKNGRTTGSTVGMVIGIGFNGVQVPYPGVGPCSFRDQMIIGGVGGVFSRPGDSGSLIVTVNTKQPVGLLFAGSADNSRTFANPIGAVMQALGIKEIVGGQ